MVHLGVKGLVPRERLRKGCDSSIMNFRDMGAFQKLPNVYFDIGFYLSEPPGIHGPWGTGHVVHGVWQVETK